MSKSTKATIAVAGLVFAGVQTWDILDKRGLVSGAVLALLWFVGAAMVLYSFRENRKETLLAQSRQAVVDNASAQRIAEIEQKNRILEQSLEQLKAINDGLVRAIGTHNDEMSEMSQRHQSLIQDLKNKHIQDIADSRRVVIHSAMWGLGGPYSTSDQTAALDSYLRTSTKELRASIKFFGDKPEGHPKYLEVDFSCPCQGSQRHKTFPEDGLITFEDLCR